MAGCWSFGHFGGGCFGKAVDGFEAQQETQTPSLCVVDNAYKQLQVPGSQAVSVAYASEDYSTENSLQGLRGAPRSRLGLNWFTRKLPRSSKLPQRHLAAVDGSSSGCSRGSNTAGTSAACTPKRGRLISLQSTGSLIPAFVLGSMCRHSFDGAASLPPDSELSTQQATPADATGPVVAAALHTIGGSKSSRDGSSSNSKAVATTGSDRSSGDCAAPGLTLVVTSHSDSSHQHSPCISPKGVCAQSGSRSGSHQNSPRCDSRASSLSGLTAFASVASSSAWLSGSLTPDSMSMSVFSATSNLSFSSSSGSSCIRQGAGTGARAAADAEALAVAVAPAPDASQQERYNQQEPCKQQDQYTTPGGGQDEAKAAQQQTPEPCPFWQDSGWSFAHHCEQNKRDHMEDRTVAVDLTGRLQFSSAHRAGLFCVFDGHGGHQVAEYLAEQLQQQMLAAEPEAIATQPGVVLGDAVDAAERQLLLMYADGDTTAAAGSTLCAVLLIDDKLHVAHVGDSRAVLARGGRAQQLTRDHKPHCSIEAQRILGDDPEAEITPDGYLYSELAVARAIGSAHLKRDPSKKALIATAEVTTVQLEPQDDFVIVATDGLWDCIDSSEAVAVARRVLSDSPNAAAASQALVQRAQRCGSADNISVVTLLLHNRGVVVPRSNSRLFKRPTTPSPSHASTAAAGLTATAVAAAAAAGD